MVTESLWIRARIYYALYATENGMVERLIRTIKEQCIYHHRFESMRNAERIIAD